jgi:carbon-monoxide dehydrogenase medium subunit
MLPAFDLVRPDSVDDAIMVLGQLGDEAAPYAGGTELLQVMKMGLASVSTLVDIKRLPELQGISMTGGVLRIGATTTHRQIAESPEIQRILPALALAARGIGNIRVRSVGTIGGNLAFAEPHSDPAVLLLACAATLRLRSSRGERMVPLDSFLTGAFETTIETGELLLAIEIPIVESAAVAHRRLAFGERPAAAVTVWISVTEGTIGEARIAVGAVGGRPEVVADASRELGGISVQRAAPALQAAAAAAARACDPVEDLNGSVAYKRELVRVLVVRAAADALGRAALRAPTALS